jgi:multidrug efflux pump
MANSKEGTVMSLLPPAIDELGTSSGFTLFLQDRANQGGRAAGRPGATAGTGRQSKVVSDVYPDSLPPARAFTSRSTGRRPRPWDSFTSVSSTLSAAMGSLYINDFPNGGHMQQVILQADASARMQLDDVLGLRVRNASGGMVPLREVVTPTWRQSPQQMMRFEGFPPCVSGVPPPGFPVAPRWRKWIAWWRNCRQASHWPGRDSRCRSASRRPRPPADAAVGAGGLPGAGRALRAGPFRSP